MVYECQRRTLCFTLEHADLTRVCVPAATGALTSLPLQPVLSTTQSSTTSTMHTMLHQRRSDWLQRADFVYSNALDHAYDPKLVIRRWCEQLADGGAVLIEWSEHSHGVAHRSVTDTFGASYNSLRNMISQAAADAKMAGERPFFLIQQHDRL